MRKMFVVAVALLAMAAPAVVSPAVAAGSGPDPAGAYIESIAYGGSGCPRGTVGQSISNDRLVFTLIFDSYVASTGPGVPVTERRKACQVNVTFHVPAAAVQKMTVDLTYRGYVQLPDGVKASVESEAFDADGGSVGSHARKFSGPLAADYAMKHQVMLKKLPESTDCRRSRTLSVKAGLSIDGPPSAPAQITTDSIDGNVDSLVRPATRRC